MRQHFYFCTCLKNQGRFRFISFYLLMAAFLFTFCNKDKDFNNSIRQPVSCVESMAKLPSMLKLFMALKDQKPLDIFPKTAVITWLDSLTSDGDGVELMVNLGHGMFCADAVNRKGELLFFTHGTHNFSNADSIFCTAGVNDSFAVFCEQGWHQMNGDFILISQSLTSFRFSAQCNFSNNKIDNGTINALFSINKENLGFNIPYLTDNYTISQAGGNILINESSFTFSGTNHFMGASCLFGFQTGEMEIQGNGQKAIIKFNPFSNQACDKLAKITLGKRETLFSYW